MTENKEDKMAGRPEEPKELVSGHAKSRCAINKRGWERHCNLVRRVEPDLLRSGDKSSERTLVLEPLSPGSRLLLCYFGDTEYFTTKYEDFCEKCF